MFPARPWIRPFAAALLAASPAFAQAPLANESVPAPGTQASVGVRVHGAEFGSVPVPNEKKTEIAGATGSIALPNIPLPPDAGDYAADASIHPAQPFSMAGASAADKSRALQCLTAAVYYEAAREPDAGQQAVAQVVLNRVRHPAFPATVCGVVYQGSEHSGCQFSFACDGSTSRPVDGTAWQRARAVAEAALAHTCHRSTPRPKAQGAGSVRHIADLVILELLRLVPVCLGQTADPVPLRDLKISTAFRPRARVPFTGR